MPVVSHLDFETRSAVDLKKVGAHRYAMDPSTEVLCLSYRVGDGPVRRWRPGEPQPEFAGTLMAAHNAGFERAIWNHCLHWPELHPSEQDCTLARAVAAGLPAALDKAGKAINTKVNKDLEGHRLMLRLCKPRNVKEDGTLVWWEDPDELARLAAYCDQDVLAECDLYRRLPPLSARERRVWEMDQRINDRGVALDVPLVQAALHAVAEAKRRADARIWRLTDGKVKKVTEAAKIVAWIKSRGIPCESIAEAEHEPLIVFSEVFDDPVVEQVVALRASSAKAFKYEAMLAQVCPDGRVRGSLGYHRTVQGRWAGSGVQFHNMKRVETDEAASDVEHALAILKAGRSAVDMVDRMELLFDSPLETLSICTRAMVVAPEGRKLVGGDYSNIEGRVNAWLAGQTDKLDAFRAYDAGTGPDLYKVTAASIIDIDPSQVTREQRQEQGKVPELACGYQGALGAFKKMGAKYGVRLSDDRIRQIVRGWRDANPCIVEQWRILQDAAVGAVSARGCVVSVLGGRICYAADGKFLYCRLPSGRYIHYPFPRVAWTSKTVVIDGDEITFNRNTVSFLNNKGFREDLYGGSQTAHVVSGIARDILVEAMFAAEEAGYELVLTVHDELLCEVDDGFGSADELKEIMLRPIPWMDGCPISASTWEGPRYVK